MDLNWRHFLVAVDERDRVIATGQIKRHRDGTLELASIATDPAWRGQGIASALITRLLAENSHPIYLSTIRLTAPFYLPFGFRELAPSEYPPYLGRIARLVGWFRRWKLPGMPELVIMKID